MKVFNGVSSNTSDWVKSTFESSIELWTMNVTDKEQCDILLYMVSADVEGVAHIIHAVNDSNHWREKVILCTMLEEEGDGFNSHQKKSLIATGKMVRVNGGQWFETKQDLIKYLKEKS